MSMRQARRVRISGAVRLFGAFEYNNVGARYTF